MYKCKNTDSGSIIVPTTVTFKIINNTTKAEVFSQVLDHSIYKQTDNSFIYHYTFDNAGEFKAKFIAQTGTFKSSDYIIYKVED